MRIVIAIVSGLIFGLGMGISQMMDRARALAFMDIAGVWDPTLLLVLGGAVGVTVIAFRFVLRRPHPVFSDVFHLPTRRDIDRPLITGAVIFGVGWGISGYCPGSGVPALSLGSWSPVLFVVSMIAGSLTFKWVSNRGKQSAVPTSVAQTAEAPTSS